jgi:hypothetical protein
MSRWLAPLQLRHDIHGAGVVAPDSAGQLATALFRVGLTADLEVRDDPLVDVDALDGGDF